MGAQRRRKSLVANRSTLASHAVTLELGTASVDQEQGMAAMMGGTIAISDQAPIRDSPGANLRERVWKWCEQVSLKQLPLCVCFSSRVCSVCLRLLLVPPLSRGWRFLASLTSAGIVNAGSRHSAVCGVVRVFCRRVHWVAPPLSKL